MTPITISNRLMNKIEIVVNRREEVGSLKKLFCLDLTFIVDTESLINNTKLTPEAQNVTGLWFIRLCRNE